MTDHLIVWQSPAYEGDHRQLGLCGHVAIGAVFAPLRGRYWRWRCWHTVNANPVDGTASSEQAARAEVEDRFRRFLDLACLEPIRSAT